MNGRLSVIMGKYAIMLAQFKAAILPFVLSIRMMVTSRPEELLDLEAMAAKLLEAAL